MSLLHGTPRRVSIEAWSLFRKRSRRRRPGAERARGAAVLDPSGASTQACDLRIAGTEPDAEVIAKIAALLAERHITAR
jgi:voltage-gated potassium channel Kch